jgi:hypothetical protein
MIDWKQDKYIVGLLGILLVMFAMIFVGNTIGQVVFSYMTILLIGLYVLIGTTSSARRHTSRPFLLLFSVFVIVTSIGFSLLWYFHLQNPAYTDPVYWLGFPRATAIVIYLIWMPPALLLMFAYPYLFSNYIWNEEQATEFRQAQQTEATAVDGGQEE